MVWECNDKGLNFKEINVNMKIKIKSKYKGVYDSIINNFKFFESNLNV